MYIKDGIAYAGDIKPPLRVSGVRPLKDYKLWVRFNNGEEKVVDFSRELDFPAFAPLKDKNLFRSAYIDYGILVWDSGNIDISPEYLYKLSDDDDDLNARHLAMKGDFHRNETAGTIEAARHGK